MTRILSFRHLKWTYSSRSLSSGVAPELLRQPDFGIVFDIDGVIVRGKKVLPFAPFAFRKLVNHQVRTVLLGKKVMSSIDFWIQNWRF